MDQPYTYVQNWKDLQTTHLTLHELENVTMIEYKTVGKMLSCSIFSFSYKVFKCILPRGRYKSDMFDKESTLYQIVPSFKEPDEAGH